MTVATEPADPFAPEVLNAPREWTLEAANVRAMPVEGAQPVLALDLGTSMGWALRTAACVSSGTMNWSDTRKGDTRGKRLLRFWRWLIMIQRGTPLALVCWEDAAFIGSGQKRANMNTAAAYAQFEGITQMFAARHAIPVADVHTSTLKKAITGSGKHPKGTSKDALAKAVRARGYRFDTQDEADALAILEWAINHGHPHGLR